MKKILFTATLLISSTLLFSQAKFGLKAGVNLANVTSKEEGSSMSASYSSQTSFHFGGFAEIGLNSTFYFQPGLSISGKGYKFNESFSFDDASMSIKGNVNFMYLEAPLNVLAKLSAGSGKFFIGAGPYIGYGLSGKAKAEVKADFPGTELDESRTADEDVKFGSGDEEAKPLDFGLNFLAGYELPNGLLFNAGYGLGLTNFSNDKSTETKHKVLSVSVGFKF
jgi:hypothetical protein